jgi:hypothetical protein
MPRARNWGSAAQSAMMKARVAGRLLAPAAPPGQGRRSTDDWSGAGARQSLPRSRRRRLVARGAILAVAGDARDHEIGPGGEQRLPRQPQPIELPGTEFFEPYEQTMGLIGVTLRDDWSQRALKICVRDLRTPPAPKRLFIGMITA